MARLNFGPAQDASAVFAALYYQYQDRLESSARNAINRAEDIQAGEDRDAYNKWVAGEMDDAAWLMYVENRVADTTNEPEETAYWREQLRASELAINKERVAEEAQAIIDKIQNNQATWNDLYQYYQRELNNLGETESPFAHELQQEITRLQDTIRDQHTASEIQRIIYEFEDAQINGTEAGRQMRAIAETIKNYDPESYYKILTQAAQLEQSDGITGGGGGSGGGGGFGSTSSAMDSISDFKEYFQTERDRLDYLRDQWDTGRPIVYGPDGQGYLLRDDLGDPSSDMFALNDARLNVEYSAYKFFEELSTNPGLTSDEQRQASAEAASALENTSNIRQEIWDVNEVGFASQFNARVDSINNWIRLADADPMHANRYLINAFNEAGQLQDMAKNANQGLDPTVGPHQATDETYGDMVDIPTVFSISGEDQATYESIASSIFNGLKMGFDAINNGGNYDPDAVKDLIAGLTTAGTLIDPTKIKDLIVNGINAGTAVGGMDSVPPKTAIVVDPTGQYHLVPYGLTGVPLSDNTPGTVTVMGPKWDGIDTSAGQRLVRGVQIIDGVAVPVFYAASSVSWSAVKGEYADLSQYGSSERAALQVQVFAEGKIRTFIQLDTGWWVRLNDDGSISSPVMSPYIGSGYQVQRFFNDPNNYAAFINELSLYNNLDPNGEPGVPIDSQYGDLDKLARTPTTSALIREGGDQGGRQVPTIPLENPLPKMSTSAQIREGGLPIATSTGGLDPMGYNPLVQNLMNMLNNQQLPGAGAGGAIRALDLTPPPIASTPTRLPLEGYTVPHQAIPEPTILPTVVQPTTYPRLTSSTTPTRRLPSPTITTYKPPVTQTNDEWRGSL